jgi:hypothetical protein
VRLYESQCPVCTQMAVLHNVCRACGSITTKPLPPTEDDDAPPSSSDETADERPPVGPVHDFDVGEGG